MVNNREYSKFCSKKQDNYFNFCTTLIIYSLEWFNNKFLCPWPCVYLKKKVFLSLLKWNFSFTWLFFLPRPGSPKVICVLGRQWDTIWIHPCLITSNCTASALSFVEQHGRHMFPHTEVVHLSFIWAHRDTCRGGLANFDTKTDPQVEC